MNARQMAGAAPAGVIELGGRTLVVRPPSVSDFAAWQRELRRQVQAGMGDPIAVLNRQAADAQKAGVPLDRDLLKVLAGEAMALASANQKAEPTAAQLHQQASTPDGVRWLVWWLAKDADSTVTPADVTEWVPDDQAAQGVDKQLRDLLNLKGLDPNSSPPPTG